MSKNLFAHCYIVCCFWGNFFEMSAKTFASVHIQCLHGLSCLPSLGEGCVMGGVGVLSHLSGDEKGYSFPPATGLAAPVGTREEERRPVERCVVIWSLVQTRKSHSTTIKMPTCKCGGLLVTCERCVEKVRVCSALVTVLVQLELRGHAVWQPNGRVRVPAGVCSVSRPRGAPTAHWWREEF